MRITEIKTVDVEQCIPENPIYLTWLNPLGGWDYWLFGTRQQYTIQTKDLDTFQPVINYLQIANGIQESLGKEAYMKVKLGYEGLTRAKVEGIRHILTSPKVYVINGSPGSNNFQKLVVNIDKGSYKVYDTGDGKHGLELTVIAPKLLLQTQ